MKKYTITSEEYELICDKLRSLENENSNLKGYIEGLEKQLTIPAVVEQSEQLVCDLYDNLGCAISGKDNENCPSCKYSRRVKQTSDKPQTGNSSLGVVSGSLLERAVQALDDYLNAGSKDTRASAADKAKQIYKDYYGKEYRNRNER